MRHLHSLPRTKVIFALAMLWTCAGERARGDVLELTNGGRIKGRVVNDAKADKSVYVIETPGGRLTIARAHVKRADFSSDQEAEYQKLASASPDTVEAHWKLSEWCREHKLRDVSEQHLARILELDPDHAEARNLLGFRKKDGQWLTQDGVMATRGLVMYEGKYVTTQHIELMQRKKEGDVAQADWNKELDRMRRWLTGRRQERAEQARTEILAIRDPAAAPTIVNLLRKESDPQLKRLWMEVGTQLQSQAVIETLVQMSLTDPSDEIRHQCLDYLIKSGRPGLSTPYIRALKNRDNVIINRAALALGEIGDLSARGPLIDALITKHKVQVGGGSPGQQGYAFSPDGGGGAGSFSFGGGGPKIEVQSVRNADVLNALVSISGGTTFDYDQDQWRSWLAAQAKTQPVDVRRDR